MTDEREAEILAQLAAKDAEIAALKSTLQKLEHQIVVMQKNLFGQKSERISDSRQADLFEVPPPEIPAHDKAPIPVSAHLRHRGRQPLSDSLPRERIEYLPAETTCGCCGEPLTRIGEEVTEEIERIPARIIVREHVKVKLACPKCRQGVKTGIIPDGVIPLEGMRPGLSLLVYLMISKYVDHLPLYRMEAMFRREGIEIARQRMSDWLAAVVPRYFTALYQCLQKEVLSQSYVKADETGIEVQDPEVKGKLFQGYFWTVLSPAQRLAFFRYFPTRAGTAARELLSGFTGLLQTDAYAGYDAVALPGSVSRIACMAHIRRKFHETRHSAKAECEYILSEIAGLYAVEEEAKKLSNDERLLLRQEKSADKFTKLHDYLVKVQASSMPESPLRKAIAYALSEWEPMSRYLDDGRVEIDNNSIERQIRPVAIGRKNYLFAGSHQGAERAAILYSLVACCRLNNVNPQAWFTDVMSRMHTQKITEVRELLPDRWQPVA